MKFFIKRKNKNHIGKKLRSMLCMVSAFAALSIPMQMMANPDKKESGDKNNGSQNVVVKADSLFTARSVFEKIQVPALDILPVSTRLDMLDYWDVDSIYKASNVMEGLSWLENVTPDYLKVRITSVSSLEIKILPEKKDKLAMTIYTVGDDVQAQDSEVNFFDMNLNEVAASKYLEMPQVKDFFEIPKGSATKMKEIEQMIPFPTMAFMANAENDNLEVYLTVEKYINQDDWNIAKLFVKPYIILEWKKGKYKLLK